jgi:hypothetical protein
MHDQILVIVTAIFVALAGVVLKFLDGSKQRQQHHELSLLDASAVQTMNAKLSDIQQISQDELWAGAVQLTLLLLHHNTSGLGGIVESLRAAFIEAYTITHGCAPTEDDLRAGVTDVANLLGQHTLPDVAPAILEKIKKLKSV